VLFKDLFVVLGGWGCIICTECTNGPGWDGTDLSLHPISKATDPTKGFIVGYMSLLKVVI